MSRPEQVFEEVRRVVQDAVSSVRISRALGQSPVFSLHFPDVEGLPAPTRESLESVILTARSALESIRDGLPASVSFEPDRPIPMWDRIAELKKEISDLIGEVM